MSRVVVASGAFRVRGARVQGKCVSTVDGVRTEHETFTEMVNSIAKAWADENRKERARRAEEASK